VTHQAKISTEEEFHGAARSRMYRLLAGAFGFPEEAFHRAAFGGEFLSQVLEIAAGLPYPPPLVEGEPLSAALGDVPADYVEFQSEYVRLFDVGVPRPPCPLFGGLYLGSRRAAMEEVTRFYNHFGLSLGGESRELPDHITTELEFMHFLTFQEVSALQAEKDRGPYLRAQRDFLQRHLARWVPHVRARAEKQRAAAFFLGLVGLTEAFLLADLAYVASLVGPGAPGMAPEDAEAER
jgi:DMSO reductase family type II enzyme chaperone